MLSYHKENTMRLLNDRSKTKLAQYIVLPEVNDEGKLSFAESKRHIPFPIRRIYVIYDVINDSVRGKHAHKRTDQLLFCLKGTITIVLDNGKQRKEITLNKPNKGVLLPRMLWHEMKDFSKDTILLVAASEYYKEADYIRNYDAFLDRVHNAGLIQAIKGAFSFPRARGLARTK
jgi:mannose-6-phosphate isomerase-like protein (cupin superfamily)